MNLRPPLSWLGSKARLASKILPEFPAHQTYVEVFGGSGALLLAKPPARVEIYNDLDGNLVNFYQVIRDPSHLKKLIRVLDSTLYSRQEFELAQSPHDDKIEAARRFMVRYRQSFGGIGQQWSYSINDSAAGMASAVRRWHAGLDRLLPAHHRLRNVQIENLDFREIFNRFDSANTLFYVDPPYIPETRVSGGYLHEMTLEDHEELVQILLNLRGKAVFSVYDHLVYKPLSDAGWQKTVFNVPAFTSGTRERRSEVLFVKPKSVTDSDSTTTTVAPNLHSSPIKLSGRAEAARRTHLLRINRTEFAVNTAIADLKKEGKKLTLTAVAAKALLSREHVGRRYKHLIEQQKL